MPGFETARKQHMLGSAAGMLLLVFALVYRFFPAFFHPVVSSQTPVQTSVVASSPATPKASEHTPIVNTPADSVDASSTVDEEVLAMGPLLPPSEAVSVLIQQGRGAELENKILDPETDNALIWYGQALKLDPKNREVKQALQRIAGKVREEAIAAIETGSVEEAERYVAAFAGLPHTAQELTQLQNRLKVIRQIIPLLANAASLLQAGKTTEPRDDNALAIYRKVLKLDPTNRVADQGLARIEQEYLDRALAAAAQDDFSNATARLAEAASIRASSQSLVDTQARIDGMRQQRAESLLLQARSALDGGDADLAEQLIKQAQVISPGLDKLGELNQLLRNAHLYAGFSPGQTVQDNFLDIHGNGPELSIIPIGSFSMGSSADEEGHRDSEEPQRQIRIKTGFALSRTEVTVGQFAAFVKANTYISDAERIGTANIYDETTGRIIERHQMTWREDYRGQRANQNLPVVNVSWNDAHAYAVWLAQRTGKLYRLPSEAEFEYALRATTQSRYPWGDRFPSKVIANITGDGDRSPSKRSWSKAFPHYNDGYWGPAPVNTYPANSFSLYDMEGNVSEWVDDCWHDNYVRAPQDSQAWINLGCDRRVIRGGSWGSAPDEVRSAARTSAPVDTRSARVGFRVARDL